MGGYGAEQTTSEQSRRYVNGFWHAVDEILNGLLFLFLSLQVFVVPIHFREAGLWAAAIVLATLGRFVVVLPWGAWFRVRHGEKGSSLVLAWGGLRGAISLALALSLPKGAERDVVLSCAFAVVVFSVLVQGLTFGPLARRLNPRDEPSVTGDPPKFPG
jgi:CPA1 family monovalent cation:H+ antiporter